MAKLLKAIFSGPDGRRVHQVQLGNDPAGLSLVYVYELCMANGESVRIVIPTLQNFLSHGLFINWSSSEASPAEQIQRRLARQALNREDFNRNHQTMKAATTGKAATLWRSVFKADVSSNCETPFVEEKFEIEPGKPWLLSIERSKKATAATIGFSADGVCFQSSALAPFSKDREHLLRKYPGHMFVEVAPMLLVSETLLLFNDDAESFSKAVFPRLEAQGLTIGQLRFGGQLPTFFRAHNNGIAAAAGLRNAPRCWREIVSYECLRDRLCLDDSKRQEAKIDGETLSISPSTQWENGFASWFANTNPEAVVSAGEMIYRLAIKKGRTDKAKEDLIKLGNWDALNQGCMTALIQAMLSQVESEVLTEVMGKGAASRHGSL